MGVPIETLNIPKLEIEKVEPESSSGLICLLCDRIDKSRTFLHRPRKFNSSHWGMTGTIKPASTATANPILTFFLRMMAVPSRELFISGNACNALTQADTINGVYVSEKPSLILKLSLFSST